MNTRPCIINARIAENKSEELVAKFHRWHEKFYVIEPSLMIGGAPGGQVSVMCALIEHGDGMIDIVPADQIRFTDNDSKETEVCETK